MTHGTCFYAWLDPVFDNFYAALRGSSVDKAFPSQSVTKEHLGKAISAYTDAMFHYWDEVAPPHKAQAFYQGKLNRIKAKESKNV